MHARRQVLQRNWFEQVGSSLEPPWFEKEDWGDERYGLGQLCHRWKARSIGVKEGVLRGKDVCIFLPVLNTT